MATTTAVAMVWFVAEATTTEATTATTMATTKAIEWF